MSLTAKGEEMEATTAREGERAKEIAAIQARLRRPLAGKKQRRRFVRRRLTEKLRLLLATTS